ncbi:MAG: glycosyltransferase [Pseudomonadota bacterium]
MKSEQQLIMTSIPQSAYRLLIVSPIPVCKDNNQHYSLDLWVEDLRANLEHVQSIAILCPRADLKSESTRMLPTGIQIVFQDEVLEQSLLEELIKKYDVVSIGAGGPLWRMKTAIDVALVAKKLKRCLVTSVTSNRSRTTKMNAQGKNWLKKIKAHLTAWSISRTTSKLIGLSDGVLVIGEGVRKSMKIVHPNLYIETASWIKTSDVIVEPVYTDRLSDFSNCEQPKMIIATRLEPMKGVHIGIMAIAQLVKEHSIMPTLTILGQGPDLNNLKALVEKNHLENAVAFEGVISYPDAFFEKICQYNLMLLTNLNEEQPRLIFDAISQGLIPICPDSTSYLNLGLPKEVFYKTGDIQSLKLKLLELRDGQLMAKLLTELRPLAFKYTISSMHEKRVSWIKSLIMK